MIDLHCHSSVSDGALTPQQVVQLAAANGCRMLALTDHDHTGGLKQARAEALRCRIQFINGVEISVTWRGKSVHIVGLDFDEDNIQLQNLLVRIRKGRIERLRRIADKLAIKGIQGVYEGALALASANPEMVSRTHIAEFLLQQGYIRRKQQAFDKYLGDGKVASVAHEWAQLEEAVIAIHAAKGIAIIAHPMRYHFSATAKRNLFQEFKDLGGDGIEVHSGHCSLSDRLNYAQMADKFGFLASLGSDFHRLGSYSGGILGQCPVLPPICQEVWKQFRNIDTSKST